jgi:hypothetical protein
VLCCADHASRILPPSIDDISPETLKTTSNNLHHLLILPHFQQSLKSTTLLLARL